MTKESRKVTMSCHAATIRQKDYAESLLDYLAENDHRSTARFKKDYHGAEDCIAEMSKLIEKMVKARKEIQEADATVDRRR